MTKVKQNRKPKKVEIESHIKTNLGRKGFVYRKQCNTFDFHHILPSDPVAIVETLDILMASKAAGNTGVRNELVSLFDELLRQKLTDKHKYKIIMLQL